jgi:hypothetical protein
MKITKNGMTKQVTPEKYEEYYSLKGWTVEGDAEVVAVLKPAKKDKKDTVETPAVESIEEVSEEDLKEVDIDETNKGD